MSQLVPSRGLVAACLLLAGLAGWSMPACFAVQSPLLGAVVIDVDSGAVLHAENANRRVRPASLTKLMTALLLMEYLGNGQQRDAQAWPVSVHAAAQPASHLGLHSGREIAAGTVLDAVLVASANDAAVVAAEAIAGDESAFAQRMNDTAARLGMARSRFANASGLPADQFSTARDIAVLARHLWRSFPQQRARYAQTGMQWSGHWVGTTNPLLGSYRGARGMKTGFTCRAGFHLVGAAQRDGRTLIAVVLGARERDERSRQIHRLLDAAFANRSAGTGLTLDTLASVQGQGDELPVSTEIIAQACLHPAGPSGWNIDVGVARSAKAAEALARTFINARRSSLRGARPSSLPRFIGVELHRAIVTGLDQDRARIACLEFRKQGGQCIIFGAEVATAQLEEAARVRVLEAEQRAASTRPARK